MCSAATTASRILPSARSLLGPTTTRRDLAETRVALAELNWLGAPLAPGAAVRVAAKLRSAQPPLPATLHRDAEASGSAELVLDTPAGAVAPGQAAVLYDGDRVLGGGWIRRRMTASAASRT